MGAAGLPAPGCLQKVGQGAVVDMFGLKMANYTTHKIFKFQCVASSGRGFGTDFTNKKKIKSKKRAKDVALDTRYTPLHKVRMEVQVGEYMLALAPWMGLVLKEFGQGCYTWYRASIVTAGLVQQIYPLDSKIAAPN